jgi:hypothetical protein
MKNFKELDAQMSFTIRQMKCAKAGTHSYKHSRKETPRDIEYREWVDSIYDWQRKALLDIRAEFRKTAGI